MHNINATKCVFWQKDQYKIRYNFSLLYGMVYLQSVEN